MPNHKMKTVTIWMDTEKVYNSLQQRAFKRGITVPELMRRAVALDSLVHENDNVEVHIQEGGQDIVLRLV